MKRLILMMAMAVAPMAACGGDPGTSGLDLEAQVVTLDDAEAATLCDHFIDVVCSGSTEGWCTDCVTANLCADPAMAETMRTECLAPIAVSDVEECAASVAGLDDNVDPSVCITGMGGCVFDVGDLLCNR